MTGFVAFEFLMSVIFAIQHRSPLFRPAVVLIPILLLRKPMKMATFMCMCREPVGCVMTKNWRVAPMTRPSKTPNLHCSGLRSSKYLKTIQPRQRLSIGHLSFRTLIQARWPGFGTVVIMVKAHKPRVRRISVMTSRPTLKSDWLPVPVQGMAFCWISPIPLIRSDWIRS